MIFILCFMSRQWRTGRECARTSASSREATPPCCRNDPNGPVYYKGIYHLFYQFNPTAAVWGDMHWGHAISRDGMLTWEQLPVALSPDQPYDVGGVFSGSITLLPTLSGEHLPVISYTCVDSSKAQMQCLAVPADAADPTLQAWVKPNVNPFLPKGPLGTPPTFFRDPSTAWQLHSGSDWLFAVGAVPDGVPSTVVYAASTQSFLSKQWRYNGTLFTFPQAAQWADMYECPDFFPLPLQSAGASAAVCPQSAGWDGQVWAAKISALPGRRDYIALGCFDPKALHWEQHGNVTLYDGGVWYASKTFDADGRRVLWGWVTETDAQANWVARGWAGVQSLPLVLSIHPELMVVAAEPLPQLSALTSPVASAPAPAGANTTLCASCKRQLRVQGRLRVQGTSANVSSMHEALALAGQSAARLCMGAFDSDTGECSEGPQVVASALPAVQAEEGTGIASGGFIDISAPQGGSAACAAACAVQYGASCVAWQQQGSTCSLFSFVGGLQQCSSCTAGIIGGVVVTVGSGSGGASMGALAHASTLGAGGVHVDVWYDRSIVQLYAAQGTVRLTSRWYNRGNATVVISGAGSVGPMSLSSVGSIWGV